MPNYPILKLILATALLAAFAPACQAGEDPIPASLAGPRAMTVAQGEVCLPAADGLGTISANQLLRCPSGSRGSIGLVVNERMNSVAVLDMSLRRPRVVNIDTSTPGVGHIPVGRYPVDIAASRDGTVAYVLNGLDRTLSPINLWVLRGLDEAIALPGTPRKVRVGGESREQVVVALANPSQLWIRSAMRCEEPTNVSDRRSYSPDPDCDFADEEEDILLLDGHIADLDTSPDGRRAFVVYNDRSHASIFALEDTALEEFETACIDGRQGAPCEMARIELRGPSPMEGYVAVSLDPIGRFAYVVDRANHQVLVIDATRHELIDATIAAEPPTYPFNTDPGVPVVRSPLTVKGDVVRTVVWQDTPQNPTRAIMRYTYQALVASDAGSVVQLETMTSYCEVDAADLLSDQAFYEDHAGREASVEAACLLVPTFPMNEELEEDETLSHRLFELDPVRLTINPGFQLRDGAGAQGRLVGRSTCHLPEELQESLRQTTGPDQVAHCASPLVPQPLGLSVDAEQSSFAESPRADLLQERRLVLFNEDGEVAAEVVSAPYDIRLRDEEWTIAYEGVLPATSSSDRGMIDRNEEGIFLSGGVNFCTAGVNVGDRLIILTQPEENAPAACAPFRNEADDYLTYEVSAVLANSVELTVIGGDFVDTLPTRECFNRGLRYNVRPVDEWIVTGERSGYVSDRIAIEGECVERPGAELGRTQARVRTGEVYTGPYLNLRIHEGELEPVRGLRYGIQVERNFAAARFDTGTPLAAQILFLRHMPDGVFLAVPDLVGDFVYMRNLAYPQDQGRAVR